MALQHVVMGVAVALVTPVAAAAPPKAEIERAQGAAQAVGAVHTVRQIPEACTRIEGVYTGADPAYRIELVRTSAQCQPRAAFLEAARVQPGVAAGWVLNEVVRIPSAACRGQLALVQVWRKPAGQQVALDGQGRSRVYLEDAKAQAAAGRLAALPAYAVTVQVQGRPCT